MQVLAPRSENVPLGQMMQGWPISLYLPASHIVHSALMYVEKLPRGQVEHMEDPASLYTPGKQALQVDAETAPSTRLYVPAGQGVHSTVIPPYAL